MTLDDTNLTIAKSPDEILKMLILERREAVINSLHKHNKLTILSGYYPDYEIRSDLLSLFYTIHSSYKIENKKDKNWSDEIIKKIRKGEYADLEQIYLDIEDYLYRKHVTKFDTVKIHDFTMLEEDNKSAGL